MSEQGDGNGTQNFDGTSLDNEFEQQEHYNQYIKMLRNNNEVITLALRKAEDLIVEYKQDNDFLKERNNFLEKEIVEMNDEIQYLKQVVFANTNQDHLDSKIRQLKHQNQTTQLKMKNLAHQLEKSQRKVQKLTKAKQESIQKNFHNFFEFGVPSTFKNKQDIAMRQKQLQKEIRCLQWKLEQRQDEITYMIRVNKILQDRLENKQHKHQQEEQLSFRKSKNSTKERYSQKKKIDEKFLTCSTQPNHRLKDRGISPGQVKRY